MTRLVTQIDIHFCMDVLRELEDILNAEKKLNSKISEFCKSDFHDYKITAIHPNLLSYYINMIKHILGGDDIAEYYLFECDMMRGGGRILTGKKEYKIRNIGDVLIYCNGELLNKQRQDECK